MTIRAKLATAIVVAVTGLALTAGVGIWGMNSLGDKFDDVREAGEAQALALELKYDITDFNGWQTAYGYDNGASRPIFLRSVARFRTDLKTAKDELTSPAEQKLLADIEQAFNAFMALDVVAYRALQNGNEEEVKRLFLGPEIKNFQQRDAILCVDGQEILNFGRQSIPTFTPGHRLNSGPFGTMGVGLPFAVGAKAAKPNNQVICLHGDGSFGQNAMELDTAVRHKLPLLCVISLNGGWTADPERNKPGRDLGYTRYDKMAEAFGAYGEYVENPEDIRPALERAQKKVDDGMVALVNVKTDYRARATTVRFSNYMT